MQKIITLHDLRFEPYLTKAAILAQVQKMGAAIQKDFQDKKPVFLAVLNGSFIFAADLARACEIDLETTFIKLSSYHGTASTGEIKEVIGLDVDLKNRHVVIVEDIIDSGQTLYEFIPKLEGMGPASISLAVLLLKPDAVKYEFDIPYLGFEIPNKFVVGYGLDYNGLGRNLEEIYQLVE